MGLLKKTASGVLAIFPCSRRASTLRAQNKGDALRDVAGNTWSSLQEASGQDWTDPSAGQAFFNIFDAVNSQRLPDKIWPLISSLFNTPPIFIMGN